MDTPNEFTPLSPQHLDPDAFRRVWNRVMPDQKDCPIALSPARPERSRPAPQSPAVSLDQLHRQLHAALLQAQLLARRTGGNRALVQLTAQRQQDLRRLRTAHFLSTGRRFQSHQSPAPPPADLAQALREQFLWEQRWQRDTLAAARSADDPALAQLLRELSQNSRARSETIRTLLERLQSLD